MDNVNNPRAYYGDSVTFRPNYPLRVTKNKASGCYLVERMFLNYEILPFYSWNGRRPGRCKINGPCARRSSSLFRPGEYRVGNWGDDLFSSLVSASPASRSLYLCAIAPCSALPNKNKLSPRVFFRQCLSTSPYLSIHVRNPYSRERMGERFEAEKQPTGWRARITKVRLTKLKRRKSDTALLA